MSVDNGSMQDLTKTQDLWYDEDAELAKSRSMTLMRIEELSRMDSPRIQRRISATDHWQSTKERSSAKEGASGEVARIPTLKSASAQPSKLSIVSVNELKERQRPSK